MKISIEYGFAEGSWHSAKFRKSIELSGHTYTKSISEADVIVAHSGGCFMLANNLKPKLILLVNLPYLEDIHPLREIINTIELLPKSSHWFKRAVVNSFYFVTKFPRWIRMNKNIHELNWPNDKKSKIVVVRTLEDNFSDLKILKQVVSSKKWLFKELPGRHDALWKMPDDYLELIEKLV